MDKTPGDHLLFSLESLVPYEFEKFKFKLISGCLEKEQRRIPRGLLLMARPVRVADLLVTHYGERSAVQLTLHILRAINHHQLAEQLHSAVGPDYLGSSTDAPAAPPPAAESQPRRPRPPDSLDGDAPRPSGDGAPASPAGQPEASRAPPRKTSAKRKEPKGAEGPDAAGKPGARSLGPAARKGAAPSRPPVPSVPGAVLRRNASSAGRLQECSGGPGTGPLARREFQTAEGKERPKSLEIPISSEGKERPKSLEIPISSEKGPPNPRALLTREDKGRPGMESALCLAPEGDPAAGACAHGPPSDTDAPGLGAPLLPQCERHMSQAQLLFCEDHGEPVCLICRLSQEHLGHRVRPLQEAALDYKEQIQTQLELLKGLRMSGERQRSEGERETVNFLKQTGIQKQRVRCQLEHFCHFLKQLEQLFVAKLEELDQTVGQAQQTYGACVAQDISLLDGLIGELEAKQSQPEWKLMQDVGVLLRRARMVTAPKPWATPAQVEDRIHMLYQKSEFMEKKIKRFSESLRLEMEALNVPELMDIQAHAAPVTLDPATAHTNLVFTNNMRSVRLGSKSDRLPSNPERFDSCLFTLGVPRFLSGRHYWEVEVGNKTCWVLGVCKASVSRKGSVTLSPDSGYWVMMMMKRNEYQASTLPPTRLQMKEPPKRVGIFLDYNTGSVAFYNVTTKFHIYTFTGVCPTGPLQPIFSPGAHDGGRNVDPLTICPVGGQEPH